MANTTPLPAASASSPPPADLDTKTDYTTYTNDDLIARITALETQLREQTARFSQSSQQVEKPSSAADTQTSLSVSGSSSPRAASPSRRAKPFDPSQYSTRHIALKFAYLGANYNGYEHANGTVTSKPTIEEVLWKALRKTRLISPDVRSEQDGVGVDDGFDVVFKKEQRERLYTDGKEKRRGGARGIDGVREKVRLDISWEGCQYSKCGRTDKGVSAFGQVVGVRVRSNRPREVESTPAKSGGGQVQEASGMQDQAGTPESSDTEPLESEMPTIDAQDLDTSTFTKPFDPISDEIAYIQILNSVLPPDIRILAWCPTPPPTFDARFSCRERRYKYFFTNPAFCPTPGPNGLRHPMTGKPGVIREGWLDIDRMKKAAKKLEGSHDFRNLCKIDPGKQMPSCVRRITFADVEEFPTLGSAFTQSADLNQHGDLPREIIDSVVGNNENGSAPNISGPKIYTFTVHGSAFLWHQVRCIVGVLFLIGQGLESPDLIDQLLDIEKTPGRPSYEMADDAPLVLWDCIFPERDDGEDALQWIYPGDEKKSNSSSSSSSANRIDTRFGVGGTVDESWKMWRGAKIHEILTGALLDLTLSQGGVVSSGGASGRDGAPPGAHNTTRGSKQIRSAKTFDGGDTGRIKGKYVTVMKKPRLETLEVLNQKFRSRKGWFPKQNTGGDDDGEPVNTQVEGETLDDERAEQPRK